MTQNRITQLLAFLEKEPNDPFLIYAVANEYVAASELPKAKTYFDRLLEDFPDYLPTYYHAAALEAELDNEQGAEQIYQKGIEIAKKANEWHALRELQAAYQNFQMGF
ncbi:MAG: tetratricopeptide repeat protein [Bernardetiaceae bacterium]|nr:tetratricopeptide repeat protein [Bernardetiaceae bacterium]